MSYAVSLSALIILFHLLLLDFEGGSASECAGLKMFEANLVCGFARSTA